MLLSDQGTNLLSYIMQDVCKLLGMKKVEYYCTPPAVQWDGRTVQLNLEDNAKETCFQIWSAVGHIIIRGPVHGLTATHHIL